MVGWRSLQFNKNQQPVTETDTAHILESLTLSKTETGKADKYALRLKPEIF